MIIVATTPDLMLLDIVADVEFNNDCGAIFTVSMVVWVVPVQRYAEKGSKNIMK